MADDVILELDRLSKRFGRTVTADGLSLTVNRREFFTFLGPSGSGKSTILRMVAGLVAPDSGRIVIEGRDVAKVPPWRRNLGMMFQQYAVFPHMSVAENVGYGLKVRGERRGDIARRVGEMIDLVGLGGFADKSVTHLSGGEQQRVALARALAPSPRILLLDEPLSALDEKVRRTMQGELSGVHKKAGTTFLYVTHDQEEALTMSSRIAVVNNGRIVQCDEPERLYKQPRTHFVAGFFRGCNVLEAPTVGHANGVSAHRLAGVLVEGVPAKAPVGLGRHIAIRSENLHIGGLAEEYSCRIAGTLVESTYRGTVLDYVIELADGQRIVATTTRHVAVSPGSPVTVGFAPDAIIPLED
jgi:ABC-type Fe3+/spermidine/putrescine transport system ATPase subunit